LQLISLRDFISIGQERTKILIGEGSFEFRLTLLETPVAVRLTKKAPPLILGWNTFLRRPTRVASVERRPLT